MKKFFKIVLIVLVVFIGFFVIAGPLINRHYQNKYYKEEYKPEEIQGDLVNNFPKEYVIKDVPWISNKKAYCQSTAFQMIAQKYGVKEDIGYFNFLMGFTYGVFFRSDMGILQFYEDPISGLRIAAPYVGLKMRFFTTKEKDTFLNAVRFYISKGYPVVIELDASKLWGETTPIPHAELFVGYDENGFKYFETGKENRFRTGGDGFTVTDEKLVEATSTLAKGFGYPWKFSFIVFEKDENKKTDIKEIWTRNGNLLVGKKMGTYASGSYAIEEFALYFKKKGKIKYPNMLESSSYTRLDDAEFLKKYFYQDEEIKKASGFLKEAGEKYERVLELMKVGDKKEEISQTLFEIASLERNAGEIFLKKGK